MKNSKEPLHSHIMMMRRTGKKTECLLENSEVIETDASPEKILEAMCLSCGSSLRGRRDAFRFLTGAVQKAAVLISERSQLIYFPLTGNRDPGQIWICYNDVLSCHSAPCGSRIRFCSAAEVFIPCGMRVVGGQMKRCESMLEKINSPGCSVIPDFVPDEKRRKADKLFD